MNKEFRNLVEKEEFWKDIPDKYQWVAVDGPLGEVFAYEGEPSRNLSNLTDKWFDEDETHCYITNLSSWEPDKVQRPTFSEKTDPDDINMKAGDKVWIQMYGGSGSIPSEVEVVYIYGDECVVKFEENGILSKLHVCGLNDLYKDKPIPNKVREVGAFISNVGNDPLEIAEHLYYGGWIRD